jgi:putative DNA primase/helicase
LSDIVKDKITCFSQQQLEKLIVTAECWHDLGFSIIPFFINPVADNGVHDKKPMLPSYAQWEKTPQTKEEFKALDWRGCNGFGILLGHKTNNDRYLGIIDFDPKVNTKNKSKEEIEAQNVAIQKGAKVLVDYPVTMAEMTVNKGTHKLYWSKQVVETCGTFHDVAALELLGKNKEGKAGKLCVMCPSYGYNGIGSDVITEVNDLGETFAKILKENGICKDEKAEVANQQDNYSFSIDKIIDLTKLEDKGNGEYQGSHPIHDSSTEKNFTVDTKKNAWFCFRHNSGGGVLQYLAMKEGLIKCEDAKKGALRGKKWQKTLEVAVAQKLLPESVLTQIEINPIILAKEIMKDYVFVTDREANELYYHVAEEDNLKIGILKGIYSNSTEQLIKREIAKRLQEDFKSRYYTEINEFIKATAPLVKMDSADPEILPIKNGLLNVLTRELKDYTSEAYVTNKLHEVTFNPEEKSMVWYNFLNEVLPNTTQQKQFQQLVGHCLIRTIITETCAILLGKGANGKTITLLTLTKFLGGSKNVSSHSIQQLCYDKFATGEIRGKLANICADLPHKELLNTAIFKGLTSGDSLEAYIKHVQKTVSFTPTTKFIFSANQTPPVANEEDTFAWYRRFVFMDFNVMFTGKKAKPRQELINSLATPAVFSEILNWALDGLTDLIANGGEITDRPTEEEIRLQYIKRSDSALAYFNDKVTVTNDSGDYVFLEVWFRDYVTYCHVNGLKPKTEGEFINVVKNHLSGVEKKRIRPEPKSNPLTAYRYLKVSLTDPKSVQGVQVVQGLQTTLPKTEKKQPDKNSNSEVIVQKPCTSSTPSTDLKPQEPKEPKKIELKGKEETKAIPTWHYKLTKSGEKCDCGKAPVIYELMTPQGDQIKKCETCYKNIRSKWNNAKFEPWEDS